MTVASDPASKTPEECQEAPFFEIVTVVWHDQPGLARTRETVMSQSFHNWRWHIIDGASSDDTLAALEGLDDDPRVVITSEPDKGLYDAMNKGILAAEGRYVNLLNAGDVYTDADVLKDVQAVLTAQPVDMLFGGQIKCYPNGEKMCFGPHEADAWMRYSLPASHQAIFVRGPLHKAWLYRDDMKVAADYRCIAEIYNSGASCLSVERPIIYSDKSTDSTTFRFPWQHIRECAATQREVFSLGRMRILKGALRRMLPILYWRLSSVIPGMGIILEAAGRGHRAK